MSRFGKGEDYTGFPCPNCGRYRLVHYSKGFDICEKCDWCVQLNRYTNDEDFMDDCRDCREWDTCSCGRPGHEGGTSLGYPTGACAEFKPREGERE